MVVCSKPDASVYAKMGCKYKINVFRLFFAKHKVINILLTEHSLKMNVLTRDEMIFIVFDILSRVKFVLRPG